MAVQCCALKVNYFRIKLVNCYIVRVLAGRDWEKVRDLFSFIQFFKFLFMNSLCEIEFYKNDLFL